MQRKLNWRLALVLMVLLALVASAVYGVHRMQIGRSKELFLTSAEEAAEEGNLEHAVKSYDLYLRLERRDAAVHSKLGQLYVEAGDLSLAYSTFEQALRLAPEDDETRQLQVAVAMELQRFLDAEDHLRRLLSLRKGQAVDTDKYTQEDAELFDLLGQCQFQQRDVNGAANSFVTALQLDPEHFGTYGRLAGLLRYRLDAPLTAEQMSVVTGVDPEEAEEGAPIAGPREQAEQVINAVVARYPESARAFYERAQYFFLAAQKAAGTRDADKWGKDAATDAEFAIQRAPEDTEIILLASQCHLSLNELDEAEAHAKRGLELAPKTYHWYSLLAEIEDRRGNSDESIRWYRRGIADVRVGRYELINRLVTGLLNYGILDEAEEAINDLRAFEQITAARWVTYHEGRLLTLREKWNTASRVLESVRPDFRNDPRVVLHIDSLLARCYEQLGNDNQRLTAIRRAVGSSPGNVAARLELVRALTSSNRMEDAIAELRAIVTLENRGFTVPTEVFFELAGYEIRHNLRLLRSRGGRAVNWQGAEQLVERASQKAPGIPRIAVFRAQILVGKGQPDAAVALLENEIQNLPEELELRIALSNLHSGAQQWDSAEQVLNLALEELGDSVELRLAFAQLTLRRSDRGVDPDRLYDLASDIDAFSTKDQARLLRELANYGLAMREADFAVPLVDRLLAIEPDKLDNWSVRFNLALRQVDSSNLDSALAKIEELEGQGPLWHYGSAVRLHLTAADDEIEKLEKALEHLDQSKMTGARAARVALLKGHIQSRAGKDDAAIESFKRAIDMGERNPETVRQTVQLLLQRQRYQDADEVIKRFEERQVPYTPELGRLARQVSLQLNDFTRSIDLARQTAQDSTNYQDYLWFAQLAAQGANENPELLAEAEQAIRKSIELAENVPETWVAFVLLLRQADKLSEVDAAIAEAKNKIPEDLLPLALAQCYEGVQRFDEAEAEYQRAIAADSENPSVYRAAAEFFLRNRVRAAGAESPATARAESYLKKITTLENATPSDTNWARYRLASLELLKGGPQHLTIANNLLLENLKDAPDSTADMRLRGVVLANMATPTARGEALKIWQQVGMDNLTPYEGFVIAQLYESRGQWREAAKLMQDTIARTTGAADRVRYVAAYVGALIRNGELNEADGWVDTLRQRGDAGPELVANLAAQVSARRGDAQRAVATLEELLESQRRASTSEADQARVSQLQQRVRVTLESLARSAENSADEKIYLQKAEELIPDELARATFLAQRNQFDQALEIAESNFDASRPAAVLPVAVAVIESARASEAQLESVDRILSQAVAAGGDSREVKRTKSIQARLFTVQRRFEEAEDVYRELIAEDDQDFISRNNLAMVLVGQKKELDEANRHVEQAIKIAGNLPQLLDSQALVALAKGQPNLALELLQRAVADMKAPDMYFHLAAAHLRAGQRSNARAALLQANEMGLDFDKLNDFEQELHRELEGMDGQVQTGLGV